MGTLDANNQSSHMSKGMLEINSTKRLKKIRPMSAPKYSTA